jgi:tetratricopeptide (TPR) repeat protein
MDVMLRRTLSGVVIAGLALGVSVLAQQDSSSAAQQTSAQTQSGQEQSAEKPEKQPSKLKKLLKRAAPNCAHIGGAGKCWSESEQEKEARKKQEEERQQSQQQPPLPPNKKAPRSDDEIQSGESSSRSNVDLSPPPGDATAHDGAAISDVEEFHSYDPHKAMKNVEVGDFYFKRGNYGAAASRYAEALLWKPNDAIATYRLAESQEKLGKLADALKNYQGYLKILPKGEYAELAKQGITRLATKTQATPPAPQPGKLQSKKNPPTSPSEHTPR